MIITRGLVVSLAEPVFIPFPLLALQLKENNVSDAITVKRNLFIFRMMIYLFYLSKIIFYFWKAIRFKPGFNNFFQIRY